MQASLQANPSTLTGGVLRVLSLNMQVGLDSSRYRHYVTRAWRHVLPSRAMQVNLDRIAMLAAQYDAVALQEADAGSLRTGQINQVAYIARRAGLPYWHAAVNRDLGPFAQHCLGFLSRVPFEVIKHHALPGLVPGRGALEVEIKPKGYSALRFIVVHLGLRRRARSRQLAYLNTLLSERDHTLVLGDLNCEWDELCLHPGILAAGHPAMRDQLTFPSWRPRRCIDHVLITPNVDVIEAKVLTERLSDHLPLATEVRLRLEK